MLLAPNPGTGEGGRVTAVLPFKTLDRETAQIENPSWSPDGERIVYQVNRFAYPSGNYVVIADVATGAETIVCGPGAWGPDWDPLDLP